MALFGRKKKVEAEVVEEVKTKKVATKETKETKTKAAKSAKKVATKKEVKETTDVPAVKAKAVNAEATTEKSAYGYRITEKATRLADRNVYVLNVPKTENKTELKKVLEAKYKVTVLGINMVNSPKKVKNYKGRPGMKGGGKKAYITLKAGESIVL